jgi:hypothetical protein
VVAALDSPAMDEAFTEGQPLRLRAVVRKVSGRVPPPARPLDAARRAIRGYRAAHHSPARRAAALLPVRMRAAWMLRRK